MNALAVRVFSSHPFAKLLYANILGGEQDLQVVEEGEAFSVGIFDSLLTDVEGMLNLMRIKSPSMRPLLVSNTREEDECLRWIFRGVWGLLPYEECQQQLAGVVRHIAEGQLWFPPSVIERWMQMTSPVSTPWGTLPLTHRERQVMELLLRRLSNKEIGSILRISERTVKFHVGNILTKLQMNSRRELSAAYTNFIPRVQSGIAT
jgi:two-component system, NarL family, response regulator